MASTLVLTESNHDRPSRSSSRNSPARQSQIITYTDCSKGLGIKIIGGCNSEEAKGHGIFVRRILIGGLAARDGRLTEGDQILEVNGQSLGRRTTNERAVAVLRSASATSTVQLVVSRDEIARSEYLELLENQSSYSYSTATHSAASSRANTPLITADSSEKRSWVLKDGQMTPVSQSSRSRSSSPDEYERDREYNRGDGEEEDEEETETETERSEGSETETGTESQEQGEDDEEEEEEEEAPPRLYSQSGLPKIPNTSSLQRSLQGQPAMASTPQGVAEILGGVKPVSSNNNNNSLQPNPVPSIMMYAPRQPPFDPSPVLAANPERVSSVQPPFHQTNSSLAKLSLDPQVRLKVEKLEVALKYLGLDLTSEQQFQLRRKLHLDTTGCVNYGEFVQVAREMFKFQLKDWDAKSSPTSHNDFRDFTQPPAFKPEMSYSSPEDAEDLHVVMEERDKLKREVEKLKVSLREKERACQTAEEEVLRLRREAQGAIHESRNLRSKVHLAEQAQKAARNMEQDYEEVVQLLESEISDMKTQQSKELESPAVQKRLAVLSCQLRKAEVAKKTYEVATEKLLHFAENVHETLTAGGDGIHIRSESNKGEPARGNMPPGFLARHKKYSPQTLGQEAKEVVRAVKSIVEVEPLPFGWEEAYTADGTKYYINHVTQTTSWTHPISNVQHLPKDEAGRGSRIKETRT